MTIGLTGVTGHVGRRVRELLSESGPPLVLLARTPGKVVAGPQDDVRRCDFADPEGAVRALSGVDTLLMVSASEAADRLDQHRAFVRAAATAGVQHVVYTSFQGAAADCTFTLGRDHWATEQAIRDAGLRFTFLRDSFYADFVPLMAQDGVIRGPAGDGRVALVAREDVAAVAAAVLVDPDAHADTAYDLTGPEALTLGEAAALVSEVTGRATRFLDETVAEAYASRASYGAPDWQVDAWVSTYTAIAAGEVAAVSDAVPTISGRPATSLRALLEQSVRGDASPS